MGTARLVRLLTGKDVAPCAIDADVLEQSDHCRCERDDLLAPHLHTLGRHSLERRGALQIFKFVPAGMARFVGPRLGEQRDEQRCPRNRTTPQRLMAINRADKLWQLAAANPRHMPGTRLGLEQLRKVLGRVTLGPALRNGQAIDPADMLLEAPADIERATRLDPPHHRQDVGRRNDRQRQLAKYRKGIALKSGEQASSMAGIERVEAVTMPFVRGPLKGHLCPRPVRGARITPHPNTTLALARRSRASANDTAGSAPKDSSLF